VWLFERVREFHDSDLRQIEEEFAQYYPNHAEMFVVDENSAGHDRYCWINAKVPWLYGLIQRLRKDPNVSLPTPRK
jgi:hypothetical protein